jgi:hypothetical protein
VALCPQKLALTSPTGGSRSVGIVRSWTQAMEFSLVYVYCTEAQDYVPEIILFVRVFTFMIMIIIVLFIVIFFSFLQESASDIPANDRFGYLTLKSVVSLQDGAFNLESYLRAKLYIYRMRQANFLFYMNIYLYKKGS